MNEPWPRELTDAYDRYENPEKLMYQVERIYTTEKNQPMPNETRLCRLQRQRYTFALHAAKSRIAFLKKWPSAYEKDGGTEWHWYYPEVLVGYANNAQRPAAAHGRV
jgi:hypothetical protein